MNLKNYALLEKVNLLKEQAAILAELKSAPPGSFLWRKNGNYYKWIHISEPGSPGENRNYQTIPKTNSDFARQLAIKKLKTDRLKQIETRLNLLNHFMEEYPDPQYCFSNAAILPPDLSASADPLSENRRLRIEQWMTEPFQSDPEKPEKRIIPTRSGVMVRSKSEALIADILFQNQIPFRYEQTLYLGDLKMHPDFTILDPVSLSDTIIWEHFGMMDTPFYANNAKVKTGAYIDSHYIPGSNLILTYESQNAPLDVNYVSLLVAYYFQK